MKVQFAVGVVRIRASREEFEALCEGATLGLDLPVSPRGCALTVRRAEAFAATSGADGLAIGLPADELDALARRLPSRDGLSWAANPGGVPVTVSFEVDLRSGAASRPAR